MRRRDALLTLLPPLGLLSGCVTRREMPLDPTLFPHTPTAPQTRLPGTLAVLATSTVKDLVHEGDDGPARTLRVPIGAIVVQAMLASADAAFVGGAQRLDAPAAAGAGHAATRVIQAVRVSYHSRLLWVLPLPVLGWLGDQEFDVQLAVDVSLLDARGGLVWTRSYDDGRQVWPHDWTEQGKVTAGLLRLTHEAAWRLAQRALFDMRDSIEAERMRPRSL